MSDAVIITAMICLTLIFIAIFGGDKDDKN